MDSFFFNYTLKTINTQYELQIKEINQYSFDIIMSNILLLILGDRQIESVTKVLKDMQLL